MFIMGFIYYEYGIVTHFVGGFKKDKQQQQQNKETKHHYFKTLLFRYLYK